MKKLVLFAILIIGVAVGCSDEQDFLSLGGIYPQAAPLKITTRTLTTKSPTFIQEFSEGNILGLYITSKNSGNLYNGVNKYKNVASVAASLNKGKMDWQLEPAVYLNSESAKIFAYYPYQAESSFDPQYIPVKISPDAKLTCDYMYGTHANGQKDVNNVSPIAMLTMHHALTLLSFQVNLSQEITDHFHLSAIQVGNKAGGTALFGEGTMNIETGYITGSAGINSSTILTLDSPVVLSSAYSKEQQLMVIPTAQTINEGDIEVLFTINDNTYKYSIPSQTNWKSGKNYTYKLNFDGTKLSLDKMNITDWVPGNESGMI